MSLLLSHFDFIAVVADSVLVLRNLGPQRARNRALREARMSNLPRDLSSPLDAVFARLFGVMLARVWCSRGWWWSRESWNSRARKLVCVVVFFLFIPCHRFGDLRVVSCAFLRSVELYWTLSIVLDFLFSNSQSRP